MNCDSVTKLIPLYYYGELTPVDEDQVDQHLHECTACTVLMDQQRGLAAALNHRQLDVPPILLNDCRADLMAAIAGGAPRQVKESAKGPWRLFLEAMAATFAGFGRLRQPLAATLLILVGFGAGRYLGITGPQLAPGANVFSNVRDISTEADGRIRISLDETQRREITGRLEDPNIRRFVLAASRDENPAVRLTSTGLLKNSADSPQVLDTLLNTLNDPVDSIRLKALDALQPMAGDPRVNQALSHVLLSDANPAVRMQAIGLLVAHRDDSTVKLLQSLMDADDNSGVRSKASKILKDWNASIGTF